MIRSCKKPPVYFPTVTGDICSFNSQYAGLPLKSHSVEVVATQSGSGTPSPSNPRPISGYSAINVSHSGKNLLEGTMNVSCALITDGIRIISGGTSLICHLKKGITYTISGVTINRGVVGFFDYVPSVNDETDKTQTIPNSGVSTFTSNYDGLAVIYINNGIVDVSTAMLELGNQNTPYEPYNGTITTIQIGSTVYGGEYDARTGVLTVTWQMYVGGWTQYNASNGFKAYRSNENFTCYNYQSALSNMLGEYGSFSSDNMTKNICQLPTTYPYAYLALYEDVNVDDFQLLYRLLTPIEIQLPPCPIDTLLGENNIWADTGNTTLEYLKAGR